MSVLEYRSKAPREAVRWLPTLGWAVFLGMSWTWCIGMFLPVLLVLQFGFWGWVVFAVPNVIGAAAMGWTLSRETSQAIVERHHLAIETFAIVTAVFQIVFLIFALPALHFPLAVWIVIALVVTTAVMLTGHADRGAMIVCGLIFLLSIGCWFESGFSTDVIDYGRSALAGRHSEIYPIKIAALFCSCLLGFGLCPYLDPTFHRARLAVNDLESRWAFGIGFGFFFASMIVFSLGYAAAVAMWLAFARPDSGMELGAIGVHWTVQTALTIGLQLIGAQTSSGRSSIIKRALIVALSVVVIEIAQAVSVSNGGSFGGIRSYQYLMAFYGLVFPAYVWLCMIPGQGKTSPTSRQWIVLSAAIVLAMPFFYLAFIEWRMPFVIIGVAIVLLSRLFVGKILV